MNMNRKILVVGLGIAIIVAILAPFLASSNPDGLESAADKVAKEHLEKAENEEPFSPMPDYAIEGMGKGGEILAIVIGTLLMVAIGYGAGIVLKKREV